MQSSRADTQAPSVDSCARADVRCDRFHLTHYPRFFSTVQPWHLLHSPCAAASSFSGGLSNGGSCTRLLPLDIGTFCSSRTVAEEAESPPPARGLAISQGILQHGNTSHFSSAFNAFHPISLINSFSQFFLFFMGSCHLSPQRFLFMPISELSSPSWPPAQPSCFPDPVLRQG